MSQLWLVILVAILLVGYFQKQWTLRIGSKAQYRPIPGPKGLPFLGAVPNLPRDGAFLKFYEWSRTYGPFFGATLLGKQFVFISSDQVARELLVKRGAIHAGRPPIPSLHDSQSKKHGVAEYMPLMSASPKWARHKKNNQIELQASFRNDFSNYPCIEAKRLVWNLMHGTSDWNRQIADFTSRTISRLCWGTPDFAIAVREDSHQMQVHISPSGFLPNLIPYLMSLPSWLQPYPWKRHEATRHAKQSAMFLSNLRSVQNRMLAGDTTPSFAYNFYTSLGTPSAVLPTELDAAWAIGALAMMSVFTASSPIISTLRALLLHPFWLASVRAELDAIIPPTRMPEINDMSSLPTLRACIREALRWRPPIPTGIPHQAEADDVYDGYLIPAGASIFPLELAMCRDPDVYPDPTSYNPARWLDPAFKTTYREPLTQYPTLVGATAFGWGRRYCQGQELAQCEAVMAMASMLWAFDVGFKKGSEVREPGKGEEPMEMPGCWEESLIIVRPRQFGIEVVVRDEERRATLEREYEKCFKE